MSLKEKVEELNQMITQFRVMQAFEKFYDDQVIMQENDEEPRVGKDVNREMEKQGMDQIVKWVKAEVIAMAVNEVEQTAFTEWEMHRTLKQGGKSIHTQVSVQKWKDGKVVHERFYYNLFSE